MELELHQLDLRYELLRKKNSRKERIILGSLAEIGQQSPVIVIGGEADNGVVLLDGYKRVRALKKLKKDTVHAMRWTVTEPEALLLERVMRTSESEGPLEQGWLLKELNERFGLSQEELARRFDKSPSWVSRRLALVRELPEAITVRVQSGELIAHAAMKYLVPLARIKREEAEKLAVALGARQFSTRDVGTLSNAWRNGDEAMRDLIVKNPEAVLRAQQEAKLPKDARPNEKLVSDFGALCGIARRAARLIREGAVEGWLSTVRAPLKRAVMSAQMETDSLFNLCRKEIIDAGPEYPNRHSGAA
jgi:ParB family transcriptional regulator, chromosome partitioning protein